eukprot:COSAG01_NODE_221_length_21422_cov_48.284294_4_plen_80_part_00
MFITQTLPLRILSDLLAVRENSHVGFKMATVICADPQQPTHTSTGFSIGCSSTLAVFYRNVYMELIKLNALVTCIHNNC